MLNAQQPAIFFVPVIKIGGTLFWPQIIIGMSQVMHHIEALLLVVPTTLKLASNFSQCRKFSSNFERVKSYKGKFFIKAVKT